ncbi:hypothetical protein ACWGNN_00815 [Streptomyces sp. NPDC055817]|uniref:hypothetical protein n=1 Tax=Streptomyces sp. NPDC056723 TaxID=3345925 RepID=UPI0036A32E43
MDDIDDKLSAVLDQGGPLVPLMTFAEARVARYALHLLGQGDGPASLAARDIVCRLDRRFEAQHAGEATLFGGEVHG